MAKQVHTTYILIQVYKYTYIQVLTHTLISCQDISVGIYYISKSLASSSSIQQASKKSCPASKEKTHSTKVCRIKFPAELEQGFHIGRYNVHSTYLVHTQYVHILYNLAWKENTEKTLFSGTYAAAAVGKTLCQEAREKF